MTEPTSDVGNGISGGAGDRKDHDSMTRGASGKSKLEQHDAAPATFGKSAIVSVVLALLVYVYQVCASISILVCSLTECL